MANLKVKITATFLDRMYDDEVTFLIEENLLPNDVLEVISSFKENIEHLVSENYV